MLNLWNGLHPFHVVGQFSAGDIRGLRAGLDLDPSHLDALEIGPAYGGQRSP
ncbi:MAG: hypothetical protein HYU66_05445 [Armatimonadetes bacterium]|nr:hypothetical protein [Armatimonadota bacterium]